MNFILQARRKKTRLLSACLCVSFFGIEIESQGFFVINQCSTVCVRLSAWHSCFYTRQSGIWSHKIGNKMMCDFITNLKWRRSRSRESRRNKHKCQQVLTAIMWSIQWNLMKINLIWIDEQSWTHCSKIKINNTCAKKKSSDFIVTVVRLIWCAMHFDEEKKDAHYENWPRKENHPYFSLFHENKRRSLIHSINWLKWKFSQLIIVLCMPFFSLCVVYCTCIL